MRELKFRAWDTEGKKWLNVFKLILANGGEIQSIQTLDGESYGMHQVDVVRFTGLKDKNGVNIYEDDLLVVSNAQGSSIHKVWWSEKSASWNVGPEWYLGALVQRGGNLIIIGNIYENPELLEVKS